MDASAYGDDHNERAKLVGIAQHRASTRTGVAFDNNNTVLVGDTPKDIEAGTTAGVLVIGVASGKSSVEELREAGTALVVTDLTDSEHIARLIRRDPGGAR